MPLILRRMSETVEAIVATQPDLLVLVDAPDFTHRVAARVRRRLPDLPILKYVSPTVWAWRPGRARAMRPHFDRLLALLPFEPEVHQRLGGPPTLYVGHLFWSGWTSFALPPPSGLARGAAAYRILFSRVAAAPNLPGLSEVFRPGIGLVAAGREAEFVLPTLPHRLQQWRRQSAPGPCAAHRNNRGGEICRFPDRRAALAASGTVTLELALAVVPTVAAYRVRDGRR